MENELLLQILEGITSLSSRIEQLETTVDNGFLQMGKKIDALSQDVAHVVSNDVAHVISVQLDDLKREVSIIKSAVGEHELDLKYFKKISMPQFQGPTS